MAKYYEKFKLSVAQSYEYEGRCYRSGRQALQVDWSMTVSGSDARITASCGNVFLDLGFPPAEAEVMKLRAEVMIRTAQALKEHGWTQAEAAKHLGITQPRVSRLVKGKVEDFSLDTLLTLAARAGLHPELRLTT